MSNDFIIEHSEEKSKKRILLYPPYITLIVTDVTSIVFCFFVLPVIIGISNYPFCIIFLIVINLMFYGYCIYILKNYYKSLKNLKNAKFQISNTEITIFLQNLIFQQLNWMDIINIKIFRIKWDGFKINFNTNSSLFILRLVLLGFPFSKQKKIVKSLTLFAEKLYIKLILNKNKIKDNLKDREIELTKINTFLKNK